MSCLGNMLWMIFGGLITAIEWFFLGLLWCLTIVGIPLGRQCFKFASLSLAPFGKEVVNGGGSISFLANVLWFFLTGIPMALSNLFWGCVLCCTIVGIPFGLQFFKLAKLSLSPFGAEID